MKKILYIFALLLCICVPSVYSYNNPNVNYIAENDAQKFKTLKDEEILIILDYSASMIKKLNDKSRATHAVYALFSVLDTLPDNAKIGLRIFGPDEQSLHEYNNGINSRGDCKATKLAVPISGNNINSLKRKLSEYTRPFGETPIAYSLMQAINSDFKNSNTLKHIVLITDGGEGCGGDPCRFIADVMSHRNDIKIDVIAIGGDENNSFMGLTCLANSTNGKFVVVRNSNDLYLKMKTTIVYLPQEEVKNEEPSVTPSPDIIAGSIPSENNINKNIKYSNYLFEFDN